MMHAFESAVCVHCAPLPIRLAEWSCVISWCCGGRELRVVTSCGEPNPSRAVTGCKQLWDDLDNGAMRQVEARHEVVNYWIALPDSGATVAATPNDQKITPPAMVCCFTSAGRVFLMSVARDDSHTATLRVTLCPCVYSVDTSPHATTSLSSRRDDTRKKPPIAAAAPLNTANEAATVLAPPTPGAAVELVSPLAAAPSSWHNGSRPSLGSPSPDARPLDAVFVETSAPNLTVRRAERSARSRDGVWKIVASVALGAVHELRVFRSASGGWHIVQRVYAIRLRSAFNGELGPVERLDLSTSALDYRGNLLCYVTFAHTCVPRTAFLSHTYAAMLQERATAAGADTIEEGPWFVECVARETLIAPPMCLTIGLQDSDAMTTGSGRDLIAFVHGGGGSQTAVTVPVVLRDGSGVVAEIPSRDPLRQGSFVAATRLATRRDGVYDGLLCVSTKGQFVLVQFGLEVERGSLLKSRTQGSSSALRGASAAPSGVDRSLPPTFVNSTVREVAVSDDAAATNAVMVDFVESSMAAGMAAPSLAIVESLFHRAYGLYASTVVLTSSSGKFITVRLEWNAMSGRPGDSDRASIVPAVQCADDGASPGRRRRTLPPVVHAAIVRYRGGANGTRADGDQGALLTHIDGSIRWLTKAAHGVEIRNENSLFESRRRSGRSTTQEVVVAATASPRPALVPVCVLNRASLTNLCQSVGVYHPAHGELQLMTCGTDGLSSFTEVSFRSRGCCGGTPSPLLALLSLSDEGRGKYVLLTPREVISWPRNATDDATFTRHFPTDLRAEKGTWAIRGAAAVRRRVAVGSVGKKEAAQMPSRRDGDAIVAVAIPADEPPGTAAIAVTVDARGELKLTTWHAAVAEGRPTAPSLSLEAAENGLLRNKSLTSSCDVVTAVEDTATGGIMIGSCSRAGGSGDHVVIICVLVDTAEVDQRQSNAILNAGGGSPSQTLRTAFLPCGADVATQVIDVSLVSTASTTHILAVDSWGSVYAATARVDLRGRDVALCLSAVTRVALGWRPFGGISAGGERGPVIAWLQDDEIAGPLVAVVGASVIEHGAVTSDGSRSGTWTWCGDVEGVLRHSSVDDMGGNATDRTDDSTKKLKQDAALQRFAVPNMMTVRHGSDVAVVWASSSTSVQLMRRRVDGRGGPQPEAARDGATLLSLVFRQPDVEGITGSNHSPLRPVASIGFPNANMFFTALAAPDAVSFPAGGHLRWRMTDLTSRAETLAASTTPSLNANDAVEWPSMHDPAVTGVFRVTDALSVSNGARREVKAIATECLRNGVCYVKALHGVAVMDVTLDVANAAFFETLLFRTVGVPSWGVCVYDECNSLEGGAFTASNVPVGRLWLGLYGELRSFDVLVDAAVNDALATDGDVLASMLPTTQLVIRPWLTFPTATAIALNRNSVSSPMTVARSSDAPRPASGAAEEVGLVMPLHLCVVRVDDAATTGVAVVASEKLDGLRNGGRDVDRDAHAIRLLVSGVISDGSEALFTLEILSSLTAPVLSQAGMASAWNWETRTTRVDIASPNLAAGDDANDARIVALFEEDEGSKMSNVDDVDDARIRDADGKLASTCRFMAVLDTGRVVPVHHAAMTAQPQRHTEMIKKSKHAVQAANLPLEGAALRGVFHAGEKVLCFVLANGDVVVW